MLEELKQRVYEANMQLPKHGLVTFTWGNVSEIDRETGYFAIKPSGVDYDKLKPEDMVIMDLDGNKAVQDDGQILGDALDGAGHIGQLADARRLNEDAVRVVGLDDLLQCLAEITDQAAADAAGVQLIDLNAGLAHEAAVDADLAEFVLDQDDLLTGEGLLDELFDKGGLAGAEEAGENVDFGFLFSHSWVPLFKICSDVQLVGNLLH